ncbi:hypothetical protein HG1285_07402, partial [Hydrogenivirga sp. 128-5-R1-1]
SLRDLTQHLTTRADDDHAPLCGAAAQKDSLVTFRPRHTACQALVRFFG